MPHVNAGKLGSGFTFTYNAVVLDLIRSVDFGGIEIEALDSTVLASTFKQSIPGLPDPGTLSIELLLDDLDAKHNALFALAAAPVIDAFVLTFPVAPGSSAPSTITGQAFIMKFGISGITADALLIAQVEFKATSLVVFAAGS